MLYSGTAHSASNDRTIAPASRNRSARSKPDPIFAAIEAHKRAWAEFEKAVAAESKFEGHPMNRHPKIDIGSGYVMQFPADIDNAITGVFNDARSRFGSRYAKRLQPALRKLKKSLRNDLEADSRALHRAQEKAGIAAAKRRWWDTNGAHEKATAVLWQTTPTTPEGVAALAAYSAEVWHDQLEGDRTDAVEKVLANIAQAAERIAALRAS
jgi:hypothetical protein